MDEPKGDVVFGTGLIPHIETRLRLQLATMQKRTNERANAKKKNNDDTSFSFIINHSSFLFSNKPLS